jgi:hypothetical protein
MLPSFDLAHLQVYLLPMTSRGFALTSLRVCSLTSPAVTLILSHADTSVQLLVDPAMGASFVGTYRERHHALASQIGAHLRRQREDDPALILHPTPYLSWVQASLVLHPWTGTAEEQSRAVAAYIEASDFAPEIRRLGRRVVAGDVCERVEVLHRWGPEAGAAFALDLPIARPGEVAGSWPEPFDRVRADAAREAEEIRNASGAA